MGRSLSPVAAFIDKLIPGIRYPWLLVILGGLFAIDFVVPDPIPLLDEIVLGVLTVVVATWRTRQEEAKSEPIDVTPVDEADAALPERGSETESDPQDR